MQLQLFLLLHIWCQIGRVQFVRQKRVKQSAAIKEVTSKGRYVFSSDGKTINAINILVLVHVQNYKRARSLVCSSPHYITFLDIRSWNNKNFPLCVIYLLISLLFCFLRYYSTCLQCVKNILFFNSAINFPLAGVSLPQFSAKFWI